jgi:hypothetical protein
MPPPVIGFPHIFDNIVAFSSHAALLRLRACSRDFQTQVDAYLNHRLVFTTLQLGPIIAPDDAAMRVEVTCPYGRVPAFMSWATDSKTHRTHNTKALTHVDIVGPAVPNCLQELFKTIPTPLSLRFFPDDVGRDACHPLPAARQNDVYDQHVNRGNISPRVDTLVRTAALPYLFRDDPTALRQRQLSPRRVVLNIRFNSHDFGVLYACPELPHRDARQAVFIFHPAPASVFWLTPQAGTEYYIDEWMEVVEAGHGWMLPTVVKDIGSRLLSGAEVVIVGVEALESPWLNEGEGETPQAKFLSHCVQHAQDVYWEHWDSELEEEDDEEDIIRADDFNKIEFYTLDEYRGMVGPDRAAFEIITP